MDSAQFWELIDDVSRASRGNPERFSDALRRKLERVPIDDVLEFTRRFDEATDAAYTARLWGAAYLINGGCSDDGFYYFRAWLVARGRRVFEAAVVDPDSLASMVEQDEDAEFEELLYLPSEVYQERTGRDDFYDRVGRRPTNELVGSLDEWSDGSGVDEDRGPRLYPALWRKFSA